MQSKITKLFKQPRYMYYYNNEREVIDQQTLWNKFEDLKQRNWYSNFPLLK